MNRLSIRLLIAMFIIVAVSLIIVPLAQSIAAQRSFDKLDKDFRKRVLERINSPHRPPRHNYDENTTTPPLGPPSGPENNPFFREENERLFNFVRDYRQTQRQAIMWGLIGSGLLAVLLALWLSRSIAKPIEAVSRAASSLADGNLGTRVQLQGNYSQETKGLADDFNSMAESLERYEGQRQAMMADIAHELRTPLATLQFRLDALEDKMISFTDDEIVLFKDQIVLLSRLIEDLRTLSLAEAGKLSAHMHTMNLNELIERMVTSLQHRAEAAGIRLEFRPSTVPAIISGDADRLKQILSNLLENAFKVTTEGWIHVETLVEQNQVTLLVKDSGPGIPEDALGTIFERFVQGKRRDTKDKGSGLGLAIVHALVTLHQGRIQASNHAEGAQFELSFPKVANED
jgi:two-component system sensor histidine kinase BaeS